VLAESGIEPRQVEERPREEQRADDEHERQRHLQADERAAEAEALAAVGQSAAPRFHRRAGRRAGRADGRCESEDEAREHRDAGGEDEYAPVWREIDEELVAVRAEEADEESAEPAR